MAAIKDAESFPEHLVTDNIAELRLHVKCSLLAILTLLSYQGDGYLLALQPDCGKSEQDL